MKIFKALFVADRVRLNDRITGTITVPHGAAIIFCGASPSDKGQLAAWAEVPSIAIPQTALSTIPLIILRAGDEIPEGAVYRGYLLANPMLFVYELPMPGRGENNAN